jgi:hypothetical protein
MKKLIILTLLSCIGLSSFSQNTEKNRLKIDFGAETGIGLVRNSLCPMSFLKIGVMSEVASIHFNLQSYYKFEKNTSGYFNTYADIYLGIDCMANISSNQEGGLCIGYCPKSQSSNLGKSALKVSVIRKIDFFTISSDLIFTNDVFIGLTMAMGF